MAEVYNGEHEVKDEELVDFEGSDYGFGSDEELEIDEDVAQANPLGEEEDKDIAVPIAGGGGKEALQPNENEAILERKEGAESGEIEDEKDEKEDGVVVQPIPRPVVASNNHSYEGRVGESRRKHRKADLEDGELDDAAMPEGSDHEAEGNADDDDEDENDRRERKRRKDRFAAERHSEDAERKERDSTSLVAAARQHRSRGSSERLGERSGGFIKAGNAAVRGVMQVGGFSHAANMAPGIMGPGGPLVPLDLGSLPLRPIPRGFMGPLGMQMASRQNMQLQEAMAVQEHMLRSHHIMQQLAHANAVGRGRHPMAGPVGMPGMRPMVGLEFGGPFPQGLMHLQPPDLASQMNFVGPVDAHVRSPRAGYGGRGAGGMFGSSPRSGMGRQNSWPAGSVQSADVQAGGGGRGQGRGQVAAPLWADPQGMALAQAAAAQAGSGQGLGVGQSVNMGQVRGSETVGTGPAQARQGSQSIGHGSQGQRPSRRGEPPGKLEPDGTWRLDEERSARNGASSRKEKDVRNLPSNTSGSGNVRDRDVGNRDKGRDKDSSSLLSNPSKSVPTTRGHGVTNGSAASSNLIQLGGPVQKSRVLTVSGLPENTSMLIVVEAFEKQGKVTDFRKEDRGDAFTITFASVPEAISAQRHLHRSILAGRQITVEYAVQQPD